MTEQPEKKLRLEDTDPQYKRLKQMRGEVNNLKQTVNWTIGILVLSVWFFADSYPTALGDLALPMALLFAMIAAVALVLYAMQSVHMGRQIRRYLLTGGNVEAGIRLLKNDLSSLRNFAGTGILTFMVVIVLFTGHFTRFIGDPGYITLCAIYLVGEAFLLLLIFVSQLRFQTLEEEYGFPLDKLKRDTGLDELLGDQ